MHAAGSVKSDPPEPRTGLQLQGTLTPLALSALTAWAGPNSSPPPLCPCLNKAEVAPASLGVCQVGGLRPAILLSLASSISPTSSFTFSAPDTWTSLMLLFSH